MTPNNSPPKRRT